MPRVVADTTVLISAFLAPRGVASEILRRARGGAFEIVLAPADARRYRSSSHRRVVRDPNDDMVIACALAGRAGYVVTRDKDLLSLGLYEGVRMVTPRQLLDLLTGLVAG